MKKYSLIAVISICSTGSILAMDSMKPKPAITKHKNLTLKQLEAMQRAQEAMAPFIAAEQERFQKESQAILSEIAQDERERQARIAALAQEQEQRLERQRAAILAQREKEKEQRANNFLYEQRQRKQQRLLREAEKNARLPQ